MDWIFESITTWVASVVTQLMDAVSGLLLDALGTDLLVMEEYFPFVTQAFVILQYAAWALLFLITVWELFKSFGGPISDAENPMHLIIRSSIFSILIAYAKPLFMMALDVARVPYTALMETTMGADAFTFAGIESVITTGIVNMVSVATVVGLVLQIILMIALGWNYFKMLLECVERYILVGVLCYTSPLAFAMGGAKATEQVFKGWCRMVGSQLLLLVLNVWFLRAFNSSVGQFVATGGALSSGGGDIFLWLFCALAFLKIAQKFDSYLAAMGLNVAQTGGSMGFEMLMAARVLSGISGEGSRSAGSVFKGSGSSASSGAVNGVAGVAGGGMMAGFASRFKPNSFVRDAVVDGGTHMGAGGGLGFVGRTFGGMAARNGAQLSSASISSVATETSGISGKIGGDIANRSLSNYMPQLSGQTLSGTEISGGKITASATLSSGKTADVGLYNTAQFEAPEAPHSVVTAQDGSQWYQTATGNGAGELFAPPTFTGTTDEAGQIAATFPDCEDGTMLRTVGNAEDGVIEASGEGVSSSMWYSSAVYQEPDAPHTTMQDSSGLSWYAMQPAAQVPTVDSSDGVAAYTGQDQTTQTNNAFSPDTSTAQGYNSAQFSQFMPGFTEPVTSVDTSRGGEGMLEVRTSDGGAMRFYDQTQFATPRGDHMVFEDKNGQSWYGIQGTPSVEHRPIYEQGKPVYEDGKMQTTTVEGIRYKTTPMRFEKPAVRDMKEPRPPKKK